MRSALLVFPNSMFTPFFISKGLVISGEIALRNNHYYYFISLDLIPVGDFSKNNLAK